ncbi:MAG: ABC-type glutathione transport system ATPase component [Kiritimatiellia bacterium]|jgi:ABC-type glutathione transport system ATPase component
MSEPKLLLELEDLCIRTSDRVLVDGVAFKVYAGKVTAIIGHSGSGKSLSARAAMGVLDVSPGIVRGRLRYPAETGDKDWFAGVHNGGVRAQDRLLRQSRFLRGGYVTYSPQSASSALNPGRTLGHQLRIAIRRRKVKPSDLGAAIKEILDEVGLPSRAAYSLVGELSGGMAQRAALAIAVAPKPPLLIADEPETGLDPVLRRVVTQLMLDVAKEHGVGLMLISHNMDTVERVADTVVTLHQPTDTHDSLGRERSLKSGDGAADGGALG